MAKKEYSSDSSSGNIDSSDNTSPETDSDALNSIYQSQKSSKRRQLLSQKSESRLQRQDSRTTVSGNESSRLSRANSTVSQSSRNSKLRITKKKKKKMKKRDSSSGDNKQDLSIPTEVEAHKLDENGDYSAYRGKIVEYSPQNQYGRFNILLGKGAFKKVYLAYDTIHGYEVAWNIVKVKNMSSAQQMRIFQEMKILHNLQHDSILKFHTSWMDKSISTIFFITEAMHSGTLNDFVRSRLIRLRIVKRWCRHILNALEYLHEKHQPAIIHRDLKLDNIFVNGGSGEIRIGDLGLASWERRGEAKSVLGTPEYMAPEMYEESYDEKVDIYAFGMCVLEMLSKKIPYCECQSAPQIYKKVMAGKPPEMFTKLKPSRIKDMIWSCIKKGEGTEGNKSGRPSAGELLSCPVLQKSNEENPDPENTKVSSDFFENLSEDENEVKLKGCTKDGFSRSSNAVQEKKVKEVSSGEEESRSGINRGSSLQSLASKASEYKKAMEEIPENEGIVVPTKDIENKTKVETAINAEEEYNRAEGILKETEISNPDEEKLKKEEKPVKQVGFGVSELIVIDTQAPPTDIPTAPEEKIEVVAPPETILSNIDDPRIRWYINASSNQAQYDVNLKGEVLFEPVICFEIDTGEYSGVYNFDTNEFTGAGLTQIIIRALSLEDNAYEDLLKDILAIKTQYERFKQRIKKSFATGKKVDSKSFRFSVVTTKPTPKQDEDIKETVDKDKKEDHFLQEEKQVVKKEVGVPQKEAQVVTKEVGVPKKEEKGVKNEVVPKTEPQDEIGITKTNSVEETDDFFDLLISNDDKSTTKTELKKVEQPLTEEAPSQFSFINESITNLDKQEAIEKLKTLSKNLEDFIVNVSNSKQPKSQLIIEATTNYNDFILSINAKDAPVLDLSATLKQNNLKRVKSVANGFKMNDAVIKSTSSTHSLPVEHVSNNFTEGIELELTHVEELVQQLSTPTPNPNELTQLEPSARTLRKHSTADCSQNSENSTSINTNNNSTSSIPDLDDPFKEITKLTAENIITPEKQTVFDSLFPKTDN